MVALLYGDKEVPNATDVCVDCGRPMYKKFVHWPGLRRFYYIHIETNRGRCPKPEELDPYFDKFSEVVS